jgi:hypothetical protein
MSKIVATLFFATFLLFGAESDKFDYTHTFSLKKDEVAKISVIKKDYKTSPRKESEVSFRWTLFHNHLLVLLVSYEGFTTQYVLEKRYKRDSVSIWLMGDYERVGERVFLALKFSDFKDDKKIAILDVMIYNPKKRVEVRFINPKGR